MFHSFLKQAFSNLLRQKLISLINIGGLAVGITAFILIIAYVRAELHYDQYHPQAEHIVRLSQDIRPENGTADILLATNSPQVAPLMIESQSQVQAATRLFDWHGWAWVDDKESLRARIALVDANFPEIFQFEWLEGNAAYALEAPDAIVLTKSMAQRYFGNSSPLEKRLVLPGNLLARVTGVIEDLPHNTHLAFDALGAMDFTKALRGENVLDNWNAQYFHTYLLLQEGTDRVTFAQTFPGFIDRNMGEGVSQFLQFRMTALTDLHLASPLRGDIKPPAQAGLVYSFMAVAFILLGIACVNFTNLSTAKASRRNREIGVRKAIGASRWTLFLQLMAETFLTVIFALILALALIELFQPFFSRVTGYHFNITLHEQALQLFCLVLLTTFCAGVYPALFMSALKPSSVLRGQPGSEGSAGLVRKTLVVMQFSAAIALLVATTVVYHQVHHARNMDPGYSREGIVVINGNGSEGVGRSWDVFRERLLTQPGIEAVTASNTVPVSQVGSTYGFDYEGGETRSMPAMLVDFGFFETYGIELLAGRYFDDVYGEDRRLRQESANGSGGGTYILSMQAARQLGWSAQEAIGKSVGITCCGMGTGQVVGVVDDIHYGNAQHQQDPVVYVIPPEPGDYLHQETRLGLTTASLRINVDEREAALEALEAEWRRIYPDQPLSYYLLEDQFESEYQKETRQGQILALFALLAIFITCLGLYGLAAFNAEMRTKEVGVRKVMGSSLWRIVILLTSDFSKLVLISNLIAWPVAYYAMNRWLENFAYRIDLSPLVFIGSGLIALCIAWVTVGGTAAKAASAKPVLALRYE